MPSTTPGTKYVRLKVNLFPSKDGRSIHITTDEDPKFHVTVTKDTPKRGHLKLYGYLRDVLVSQDSLARGGIVTKYRITYVKEVIEVEAPTVESAISTAAQRAGRGREDIDSVEALMTRPAYVQVDWKLTGKVTVEKAFAPIDWESLEAGISRR